MATFHIMRKGPSGVYGHETSHCDEAGCAGDEVYVFVHRFDAVERGHVYEIDDEGHVIAEIID